MYYVIHDGVCEEFNDESEAKDNVHKLVYSDNVRLDVITVISGVLIRVGRSIDFMVDGD